MRISDWSSDVCSSDLVEPLGLDEERRLRGILRLAGVGARLVAAIVTQIEALAGLGLDRQDRAPRRLGEARLRLESIKRTREEGESEALAGGSIVQRLLEYALAVVSQAPAERQFPDRREGQSELTEQGIAGRTGALRSERHTSELQ